VTSLVKAGADEFYCRVLINDINLACRRDADLRDSNLLNSTELEKLVVIVKKQSKSIFLVLNVPHDNRESFSIIDNYSLT